MKLIDWQFYPTFAFKYQREIETFGDYSWYVYWVFIGPWQSKWYGKPWCNHLKRSPEWNEQIKKVLLEDLRTVHYDTRQMVYL